MSPRQRLSSERGFSLLELLVSTAIMMVVTGAIFAMVNPSQGTAKAQPEVSDIQQRMRVGSDTLFKELMMAGAGPYFGARTGSLLNFFAPVMPRRLGFEGADDTRTAFSDRLTLSYIPNSYSQTTIEQAMPPNSVEMKVTYPPNCQVPKTLCGFEIGMTVIIFDNTGHWDTFTLTQVQDDAGHLQHRGQRVGRQVLHDQPRPILVHDHVEHADDVRVLQPGPDAALAQDPLAGLLGLGRVCAGGDGQQLLHRHRAVQQLVGGPPDDTHRPGPDLLLEAVTVADAESRAPGRGQCVSLIWLTSVLTSESQGSQDL